MASVSGALRRLIRHSTPGQRMDAIQAQAPHCSLRRHGPDSAGPLCTHTCSAGHPARTMVPRTCVCVLASVQGEGPVQPSQLYQTTQTGGKLRLTHHLPEEPWALDSQLHLGGAQRLLAKWEAGASTRQEGIPGEPERGAQTVGLRPERLAGQRGTCRPGAHVPTPTPWPQLSTRGPPAWRQPTLEVAGPRSPSHSSWAAGRANERLDVSRAWGRATGMPWNPPPAVTSLICKSFPKDQQNLPRLAPTARPPTSQHKPGAGAVHACCPMLERTLPFTQVASVELAASLDMVLGCTRPPPTPSWEDMGCPHLLLPGPSNPGSLSYMHTGESTLGSEPRPKCSPKAPGPEVSPCPGQARHGPHSWTEHLPLPQGSPDPPHR